MSALRTNLKIEVGVAVVGVAGGLWLGGCGLWLSDCGWGIVVGWLWLGDCGWAIVVGWLGHIDCGR